MSDKEASTGGAHMDIQTSDSLIDEVIFFMPMVLLRIIVEYAALVCRGRVTNVEGCTEIALANHVIVGLFQGDGYQHVGSLDWAKWIVERKSYVLHLLPAPQPDETRRTLLVMSACRICAMDLKTGDRWEPVIKWEISRPRASCVTVQGQWSPQRREWALLTSRSNLLLMSENYRVHTEIGLPHCFAQNFAFLDRNIVVYCQAGTSTLYLKNIDTNIFLGTMRWASSAPAPTLQILHLVACRNFLILVTEPLHPTPHVIRIHVLCRPKHDILDEWRCDHEEELVKNRCTHVVNMDDKGFAVLVEGNEILTFDF